MKFHLNFDPAASVKKIRHDQTILSIGSCFSEHINNKLKEYKFSSFTNPFGIVFNPYSIANSIKRIVDKHYFTEKDIFENTETWQTLETHSSIHGNSKKEILNILNTNIDEWHDKLLKTNWLIITFGSAYYYTQLADNKIVANCHKLPANVFAKRLFETEQIVLDYISILNTLKQFNPSLNVIFTVSPVKHLRDGIVENSLSKAILLQSIHKITDQNSHCFYFPSYELITDDLRDYRFYEADLAHPNKLAIDYVWEKFANTYFNDVTHDINKKVNEISSAYKHKPFKENTLQFKEFKEKQFFKCNALKKQYPFLNMEEEINHFKI